MVRVRKLVLAISAASALASGMAHALGLGEVTLQSALNQPLVAEIELLEVRDLASSELIPSLAPPEEFNKAGVDRPYFLTDLKFTPVVKPGGKSVIRVTSSKPVREPYLNFLVEVLWPNGRLLREYTLLLDPPLYAPQAAPAPQAPVAATAAPRSAAPSAAPAPRATASQLAASRAIDGNEYTTTRSDTLWEIAERVRGGSSVHQAMLAIQDLNPDAFINNNINMLKSGQVLRLPDEQQIKSRSQSEAIAQVAAQNTAWRENRGLAAGSRQLDATKRTAAGATPAQSESRDSLRLVSGETGKTTTGGDRGKSGDSKALADKLAVTQESLDSTRRENQELTSRVSDLQSQLEKLQRLIQLKDEQLAKLQADLAAQPQQPQPAEVPKAPEQPSAETPAAPAEQAVKPAQTPPAEPDFNYEEPAKPDAAASQPPQPASEPASAVKPAEKPAAAKPVEPTPAPVPAVEPPQPTSMLDDLLANPMMLGIAGGGVLLLLLIGLMVVSRRNAMKEAELQNSLAAEDEIDAFPNDMDLSDSGFEGLETTAAETAAPAAPVEERVAAQTGDALGEADIYIAYGRFSQAAELLQNAINQEPQRSDLRLKLMEVQAELGDREGFARQESELREIGGSNAQIEQLKAKYPAMAAVAAAGLAGVAASDDLDSFSLDDLTLDEPSTAQPTAPVSEDLDDAFELSLDDLEADLDRDVRAAASSDMSLDLDDLSLDGDLDAPTAAVEQPAGEDLDFDLELASEPVAEEQGLADDLADFSLDLEAETAPAAAEDEFMLSLDEEPAPAAVEDALADLSLDLPEEEAPAADLELPADFDLSLADEGLAEPELPEADSFAAQLDEVSAELDQLSEQLEQPQAEPAAPAPVSAPALAGLEADDDFDFLSGTDESATKLDLARAYIDMGDTEGARDILDEVLAEGNDSQQQEARDMLARLA